MPTPPETLEPDTPPQTPETPVSEPPPPAPETDAGEPEGGEGDTFPRSYVEKLRAESAKHRTKSKELADKVAAIENTQKEFTSTIAKALGLEDAEDSEPEAIKEQLAAAQAELRVAKITSAFASAAAKASADYELTFAVLQARDAFKDLDIEADDFEAQVAEKVQAALTENPKLKAGLPTGSADQGARGGRPAQLTRADLQNMTPEAIEKARAEGRLDALMGVTT